jgi:anti-sigma factor RsiW
MHCGLAAPKLLRYLHGELSPAETSELQLHLASCRSCAAELESLRREAGQFRTVIEVAAPAGLELRTLRRLQSFARARQADDVWSRLARRPLWRALVVSAASIALAAAGLALISPPAYAMVVNNVIRFGAQVNAAASLRIPAWGEFVRIVAAIRMLIGI